MSQPIEIIAKGLTRERQRAGLSLAEVARRAGVAKSTLSQLEAGKVTLALKPYGHFVLRSIFHLHG